MASSSYVNTPSGPMAIDDPDVEEFIDLLCAKLTVDEILAQRRATVQAPPSRAFWQALTHRIWSMLEANGQYGQEVFDGLVAQGEQRQQAKTKKWKRRAKAYRRALREAGLTVPEVDDGSDEPVPEKAQASSEAEGAERQARPDAGKQKAPGEGREALPAPSIDREADGSEHGDRRGREGQAAPPGEGIRRGNGEVDTGPAGPDPRLQLVKHDWAVGDD